MNARRLTILLKTLNSTPNSNDIQFQTFIAEGLELLNMSDIDFAELVGVSRSTVLRWRKGQSVPHKFLRPAIAKALSKKIKEHKE